MTDTTQRSQPEIIQLINERLSKGEIFNISNLIREDVREKGQYKKAIGSFGWGEERALEEYVESDFMALLEAESNPSISNHYQKIIRNASEFFDANDNWKLYILFFAVVNEQSPTEFRDWLKDHPSTGS